MPSRWKVCGRIVAALGAVALTLAVSACSQTMGSSTAALTVKPDDVSASGGVDRRTVAIGGGLAVDVHVPEESRPKGLLAFASAPAKGAPVLLYVHGGGWVKGDRGKVYNLPAYAKSRGYVLVSVDYRPLPRTTIDGQVADVVKGIRWTRENIAAHGGDPARIVVMGHSSGAHLVAMVAARKLGGSLRGVVANDVQAYDLPEYYRMRDNSMDPVYVRAFGHNRADWVRYSPVTYVKRSTGFPPFLVMHSGSNRERRKALSNDFANVLRARGTRVSVFDGGSYSHGSIASTIGKSAAVTRALDEFLNAAYR